MTKSETSSFNTSSKQMSSSSQSSNMTMKSSSSMSSSMKTEQSSSFLSSNSQQESQQMEAWGNQEIKQDNLKTQIVSAITDLEGDRDLVDFGKENKTIDLMSPPQAKSPTPRVAEIPGGDPATSHQWRRHKWCSHQKWSSEWLQRVC